MNQKTPAKLDNTKRILAGTGALIGVAASLGLTGLRLGLFSLQPGIQEGPDPPVEGGIAGNLAFLLVFLVPFTLALFALRRENPGQQAAIWMGVAVLSYLGSFASFSFITLVTMPVPALLLGAAGLIAFWQAGWGQTLPILGVAIALVVIGSASFYALFTQENPRCYGLILQEDGSQAWEARPFSHTSPRIPADPEPGEPLAWNCTSDVINVSESLTSMSFWALALLGLTGLRSRWQQPTRDETDQTGTENES